MALTDWIVISTYFALVFLLAWWVTQKEKKETSTTDYFLGGRNMGWFVIGASLFASNIGSEHLIGLAGDGSADGVVVAQFEILAALILLLLGWVFVPFYLKSNVFTMPEFLEKRYSPAARTYLSWVSILAYVITKISVTIFAGGIVFETLMGIPFWTGAFAIVVATGLYTILGGLRAVVYTDMLQMFILVGGALAVTFYGISEIGGWGELVDAVSSLDAQTGGDHFNMWKAMSDADYPWTGILFGAPILGVWYWCTDQFIVQRVLAAKNISHARKGTIFGGFLKILPLFIFVIPGVIAWVLIQRDAFDVESSNHTLPGLVQHLLPVGLRGLVVAGLLAALMSSLSSVFNSCSTLFTVDIYKKWRPDTSERELVRVGQIATGLLVLLGMLWIPLMEAVSGQLFNYIQSVQAYISPPIASVFLLGIFFRRLNAKGAMASLYTGLALGMTRLLAQIFVGDTPGSFWYEFANYNFLHFAIWLFLICSAVLVAVSLMTDRPDLEKIKDITYERKEKGFFSQKSIRRDLALSGLVLVGVACVWWYFSTPSGADVYKEGELSHYDAQVDSLVARMRLEEKAGQMTQVTLEMLLARGADGKIKEPFAFNKEKLDSALSYYRVGSILNNVGHTMDRATWHRLLQEIHSYPVPDGRPALPVIYGVDAIHGVNYTMGATLFPQQIGLAATWDTRFAEDCGRVTAYETRASGIPWNFSPVLGLGRQPLWSRIFETFGEDVLLASRMGEAIVRGYQGDTLSADPEKVAACLKHFAGYSMSRTGKDRTPAWIPERQLREYFLPVFQAAIDAGGKTAMINSGEINGIPVHADYELLTRVLRGEMGFRGFTVSDWEDVKFLRSTHRVAATERDAVKMAVMAGMDMSMVPLHFDFADYLVDLVRSGEVPESRLDEAVRRILTVKFQLGLFDDPLPNLNGFEKFGSDEFGKLALDAARESVTLLKNENDILPLDKNSKVLVAGPGAHSLNALNGAWTHTWQGVDTAYNTPGKATVYEALQAAGGAGNVSLVDMDFGDGEAPTLGGAAARADVIVLCVGEMPATEKPGDIHSLDLSMAQQDLVRAASRTGKPVVLVLTQGRPRVISAVEPLADGIVMAYLPGDQGGQAIAEILYGDVNPSGKLPYTYPRFGGDLAHYDYKYTETRDPKFGFKAINPQYAFGHGLSYTEFAYSNLRLSADTVGGPDSLTVTVSLKNTGARAGKEVVQLYVEDAFASVTPSVRRLRGFSKVALDPGQSQDVTFHIHADDLRFIGRDNRWRVEAGDYTIHIGPLAKTFYGSWDNQ